MGAQHQIGAQGGMPCENNIATFREARGWSRPDLGKRMGTSGQQVERLEKGQRELTTTWIDKAASAFGVQPWQIITPAGEEGAPELPGGHPIARTPANDDEVVEITSLDLSLSMGPGTMIEDFVESEPIKMGLRFVQGITNTPTDRLRLVRGVGDSMEPTLRTSDQVMVNINERSLGRMGIYWIDYLGAHGIKRLRPAGKGRVMVMSDNPVEPDFEVEAADLRIEGRVIWYAREL